MSKIKKRRTGQAEVAVSTKLRLELHEEMGWGRTKVWAAADDTPQPYRKMERPSCTQCGGPVLLVGMSRHPRCWVR